MKNQQQQQCDRNSSRLMSFGIYFSSNKNIRGYEVFRYSWQYRPTYEMCFTCCCAEKRPALTEADTDTHTETKGSSASVAQEQVS